MTNQPLPEGRVTILWTDVVDSMRMAGILGDPAYQEHLRDPHRETLVGFIQKHKGAVAQTPGDGFMAVFEFADDALACADAIQKHFAASPITHSQGDKTYAVQVRVGVHTARIQLRPGRSPVQSLEYGTFDVSFAFRVMSLASGGQILVSSTAHDEAGSQHQYDWKEWTHRRIKSVDHPETIWELKFDGVERGEPGLRWVPSWYRGEMNRYIARPVLQAEVFKQLESRAIDGSASRLVTLKAEGGMGKTRLAITCAVQMAGTFEDGVYFVNLAGSWETLTEAEKVRGREIVAEAIGTVLGLQGQDTQPEAVLALLKDRNALLVLDNYEAVDCNEAAGFVADLVSQTNNLRLLVTGREAVKIQDLEQVLSMDDGMDKAEAEALFIANVRLKLHQEWTPTAAEQHELARILELTERIPLAVELAAARKAKYTPKEIADGLEATPLGDMTSTDQRAVRTDPSPHHASLTRSLDWSYRLLEQDAQECFAALSLFAESFAPVALAAVIDRETSEARRLLDRLDDASLIRRSERDGASRYHLHRFTSAYANEKLLALPSAEAMRRRFVAQYIQIENNHSDINNLENLNVLTVEWRNTLAAVQTAEVLRDWKSVLFLSNLGRFLNLRGLWAEQERLHQRSLTAAQISGDLYGEGITLNHLGNVYLSQCRWNEAEKAFSLSRNIFQQLGDLHGEGQTFNGLGIVYRSQGRWDEAERAFSLSLNILHQLGDWQSEGQTLNNLGNLYQRQGRWDKAEQVFNQSLNISHQLNDKYGAGQSLNGLGNVYQSQRRWDEAEKAFSMSRDTSLQLGDRHGEGTTLGNLGIIYQNQWRWDDAERAFNQSLDVKRKMGDKHGAGQTLNNLGNLYLSQERWNEAEKAFSQSLNILHQLEDRYGEGTSLGNLGIVYESQYRRDEAEKAFSQSVNIFHQLGDRHSEGRMLGNLAMLMKVQEKIGEALKFAGQAVAILETTEDATLTSQIRNWITEWDQSVSSEK